MTFHFCHFSQAPIFFGYYQNDTFWNIPKMMIFFLEPKSDIATLPASQGWWLLNIVDIASLPERLVLVEAFANPGDHVFLTGAAPQRAS